MTIISTQDLEKKALNLPDQVKTIIVKDDKSLERANKALLYIKGVRKEINDFCDPNIKRLNEAHKEALAQKKKFELPLITAEQYIKSQISTYMAEQERIRREAEEKARMEEEERKRIEEEKFQAALEAENAGKKEEAERIINEEVAEPDRMIFPKKPPKLQGIGIRKDWKWRIKDERAIPREFLTVDSAKITQVVRALKDQANIPGIEVYSEDTVMARIGTQGRL